MPKRPAHKTGHAPRVLSLNLRRQWFDEIAIGKKKIEYREVKPFWKKRIEGRDCEYAPSNGFWHPFRVRGVLIRGPGVSLCSTPGYRLSTLRVDGQRNPKGC